MISTRLATRRVFRLCSYKSSAQLYTFATKTRPSVPVLYKREFDSSKGSRVVLSRAASSSVRSEVNMDASTNPLLTVRCVFIMVF